MRPQQARGHRKRAAIVQAAADIAREQGFAAVRHRAVAERAGVPLGSTTYYFGSLDELLGAVADRLYDDCLERSARVVNAAVPGERNVSDAANLLVRAVLPADETGHILSYYELLLGAARHPAVARAWRDARPRLEEVVVDAMDRAGVAGPSPSLVLAVVDGALISALSEGRDDIAGFASDLVVEMLIG